MSLARRAIAACLLVLAFGAAHADAPASAPAGAGARAAASCPPTAAMPTAEQLRAGAAGARDRGFLWRLRKDGRLSWLYGTVHVARFEWTFPGPLLGVALMSSDVLALEFDLLDPEMQRRLAKAATAPTRTALSPSQKSRLLKIADAECVPAADLDRLSPEMQVAALGSLVGRRIGLDPAYGIDAVLASWARGSGKSIVSLETPESQLRTLLQATPAESRESIDAALGEMEAGRAAPALERVAQVWADGDYDALSRYESWCDCVNTAADRAALARLLDDRNPGLADGIAALHARGQAVFAAVGSLHMVGPTGLPALLRKRGFSVEPVAFAPR